MNKFCAEAHSGEWLMVVGQSLINLIDQTKSTALAYGGNGVRKLIARD